MRLLAGKDRSLTNLDNDRAARRPIRKDRAALAAVRTNVDTGFLKNFFSLKSHESLHMQIRAEMFNVFHHAEFNYPTLTRNSGTPVCEVA